MKLEAGKRWKLKLGDWFWTISVDGGSIILDRVQNDPSLYEYGYISRAISAGNCFRTRKEALEARKRVARALAGRGE
jgi:hypothetical protein